MANPARLKVLERARMLSMDIHQAFRHVHVSVNPDLKSQLLRAVAAISRNIAEGAGRQTNAAFRQFLDYAIGSANETEECLRHFEGLEVVPPARLSNWLRETSEVRMMTYGVRRTVTRRMDAEGDVADTQHRPSTPSPLTSESC